MSMVKSLLVIFFGVVTVVLFTTHSTARPEPIGHEDDLDLNLFPVDEEWPLDVSDQSLAKSPKSSHHHHHRHHRHSRHHHHHRGHHSHHHHQNPKTVAPIQPPWPSSQAPSEEAIQWPPSQAPSLGSSPAEAPPSQAPVGGDAGALLAVPPSESSPGGELGTQPQEPAASPHDK